MSDQPAFAFTAAERQKYAEKVDRLLTVLGDGRWYTAKELSRILLTDDRTVRKYADLSAGRVISTDKGYCLLRFATVSDIYQAQGRLTSQAKKMLARAAEYQRELNKRGTAA